MTQFDQYHKFLSRLPLKSQYIRDDLLVPELLMEEHGKLRMFFVPFNWTNTSARVMILGITPGWTQMEVAWRTARQATSEGYNTVDASRMAKEQASFAGPMRRNLIQMLDTLGLPSFLNIHSTADLFGKTSHLLETGSVIRYPVFRGSDNYTGSNPPMVKSEFLLSLARRFLLPRLATIPNAAIVPLGRSVEEVLEFFFREGSISKKKWISGFPHPSGANGHRVRLFTERRERLGQELREILNS